VAHLAGASPGEELCFSRAKIDANFSNYSAWHYRSALLPAALAADAAAAAAAAAAGGGAAAAGGDAADTAAAARFGGPFYAAAAGGGADGAASAALPAEALAAEFELVANAFFTEPEDTAGWVYHDWLVGKALQAANAAGDAAAWRAAADTLAAQAGLMRELLDMEPGARWPALALARLLQAGADCRAAAVAASEGSDAAAADAPEDAGWREEAAALLTALAVRDPLREGYYRDCVAKLRVGA
jgi:geranylgeranyl transferase type-2 subunit alpha